MTEIIEKKHNGIYDVLLFVVVMFTRLHPPAADEPATPPPPIEVLAVAIIAVGVIIHDHGASSACRGLVVADQRVAPVKPTSWHIYKKGSTCSEKGMGRGGGDIVCSL